MGLQCHVRFLWDWPTHYRGLMSGICRVYWGKLPTMLLTIYSCLWWDNPTSSPNNVGTSHALSRSFPSLHPGNNNGFFFIENPLLIAYLVPCYLPNLYPCIFPNPIPTPLLGYLPTLIPYNLICLFKNYNWFSIETPLLYPRDIVGNDLGNAWEVPTLFGLEVGLSHQRQLYIVGRIVGSFPQ